jgi:hypothetical protein
MIILMMMGFFTALNPSEDLFVKSFAALPSPIRALIALDFGSSIVHSYGSKLDNFAMRNSSVHFQWRIFYIGDILFAPSNKTGLFTDLGGTFRSQVDCLHRSFCSYYAKKFIYDDFRYRISALFTRICIVQRISLEAQAILRQILLPTIPIPTEHIRMYHGYAVAKDYYGHERAKFSIKNIYDKIPRLKRTSSSNSFTQEAVFLRDDDQDKCPLILDCPFLKTDEPRSRHIVLYPMIENHTLGQLYLLALTHKIVRNMDEVKADNHAKNTHKKIIFQKNAVNVLYQLFEDLWSYDLEGLYVRIYRDKTLLKIKNFIDGQ